MKKRQWAQVVAAVAITGAAALAVPSLPAVADHSPAGFHHDVEVGGPVALVAKGAAVNVPVEYRCGPDVAFAGVDVRVSQSRGRYVASGAWGTSQLQCDGLTHTVDVLVQAGGGSFKTGEALVVARLFACPQFGPPCGEDEDSEVVSVKK